jgi:hypothetical protein
VSSFNIRATPDPFRGKRKQNDRLPWYWRGR